MGSRSNLGVSFLFFFFSIFSFFLSFLLWLLFLLVAFLLELVLGLGLVFRLRVRVWLLDPRVTDSTSILPNLIMFSFTFAIYLNLSAVHFPAVSHCTFFARPRLHSDGPCSETQVGAWGDVLLFKMASEF